MNNSDYWANRFKIMEDALKDEAYDYTVNLEHQFDAAIAQIDTQTRAWYQRFANNNGITFADAQKMLTTTELKEFKWTVEEYIKKGKEHAISGAWAKELENASARVHVSRLDTLKYQIRQQAEELTQARIDTTSNASELAYTQSYYHTAFEIQKGLGVGWTMLSLNTDAVKKVLSRPWTVDNQTFTARCWKDKNKLVEAVNQELTRMVTTGAAPDKAIANIAKHFNTTKSNAGRVVMTESAYFSSAAQKDCFNDLGVEQYKIIGTLDTSTCETCGDMDGRIFKMSEYKEGATAPPFHPWCRCCTAPYFADMEGVGERYARDAISDERYKLPKDTTYKEWKAKQDAVHGEDSVDKERKKSYNIGADSAQYEDYISRLGTEAPTTFENFQKLKYDTPTAYNDLCGQYAYKGRVPEATAADYKAYKAVKATGITGSVRVPPKSIDTSLLTLNDDHAKNHGCTLDDATGYIKQAKCSVTRKRWDGYHTNYYAADGAAYVADSTNKIKTAFSSTDFDPIVKIIMEVFQ